MLISQIYCVLHNWKVCTATLVVCNLPGWAVTRSNDKDLARWIVHTHIVVYSIYCLDSGSHPVLRRTICAAVALRCERHECRLVTRTIPMLLPARRPSLADAIHGLSSHQNWHQHMPSSIFGGFARTNRD